MNANYWSWSTWSHQYVIQLFASCSCLQLVLASVLSVYFANKKMLGSWICENTRVIRNFARWKRSKDDLYCVTVMYNNDHLFNFCNFNMKVASARKLLINKQPEYYQIKRMKWIISGVCWITGARCEMLEQDLWLLFIDGCQVPDLVV